VIVAFADTQQRSCLRNFSCVTDERRMVDIGPLTDGVIDVPILDEVDALQSSRNGMRDLAALAALPAKWVDQDPSEIAAGLLDVLIDLLGATCAYVRFDDPTGGPPVECWRPEGPRVPFELEPMLATPSARQQDILLEPVLAPSGGGMVRVALVSPALPGEDGLVLVGSHRRDFPSDLESYLLRGAVDQAGVSIHAARRLATERAARIEVEAALRRRNAFLATLAQDLELPLSSLSERAEQAREFATTAVETHAPIAGRLDSAPVADGVVRTPASTPSNGPAKQLTRRESEVLELLARGLSNREIATDLRLSERTVERHITGLYGKLQVRRRSQATAFAIREGLVDVEVDAD
jgi:DNA-binding NarL/FixJ family response regulator